MAADGSPFDWGFGIYSSCFCLLPRINPNPFYLNLKAGQGMKTVSGIFHGILYRAAALFCANPGLTEPDQLERESDNERWSW